MRPLIGITSYLKFEDNNTYVSNPFYSDKVKKAGGTAVLLPVKICDADIANLAQRLDGILFSGGEDIDPALYGTAYERVFWRQPYSGYPLARQWHPERLEGDKLATFIAFVSACSK